MSNQKKKRILLFYASLGSGHYSAAKAIQAALLEKCSNCEVQLFDAFLPSMPRMSFTDFLSSLSSHVFPLIYDHIWKHGWFKFIYTFFASRSRIQQHIENIMMGYTPDIVVCTQSLPCSVLAAKRQEPRINLIAVSTDYGFHPFWSRAGVDSYCVASNSDREALLSEGIPPEDVHVTGIPISRRNVTVADGAEVSLRRVIILAGGSKSAPYRSIQAKVRALIDIIIDPEWRGVEWRLVFGEDVRDRINAIKKCANHINIHIHGFIEDLSELLLKMDLIITKPGGLITAEALAAGVPIGLLTKGYGQERANAEHVLAGEAGMLLDDVGLMEKNLKYLYKNPDKLADLRRNAARLGEPGAANDVADLILSQSSSRTRR
ncbi:MAG: hypothetical protein HPY76_12790 [Anaerolineae bacterium]|nr:hypothetical protein [Anaerolineae bacterium]